METLDLYKFWCINRTYLDNKSNHKWGKEGVIERLLVKPTPQIKINIYGFVNDNLGRYLRKVDSLEKKAQEGIKGGFLQTSLSDLSSLSQYENSYSTLDWLYSSKEQQEKRVKFCEGLLEGSWVRRAWNLRTKEKLGENKGDAEEILATIQKIEAVLIKIYNAPINIQIVPEAQSIYEQVKEFQSNIPNFFDLNYTKVNAALSEAYGMKKAVKSTPPHIWVV